MRSPAKTLYVLLLSLILFAGCLNAPGAADDDDDDDDDNLAPVVHAALPGVNNMVSTGEDCETTAWTFALFHAMTDWDGSITSAGWDSDLDGEFDYNVTNATGITEVAVPFTDFQHNEDLGTYHAAVIFGAEDDDGAFSSSEIIPLMITQSHVNVGPCAPEVTTNTSNNFKAEDSSAMISTGTDDNLMRLRWIDARDDLNWALVSIQLEVGNFTFTCSVQDGEDCSIAQTGSDDGVWENDEFVYLHENGADICGDDVSCAVSIYVQYSGSTVVGTSSITLS